MLIFSEQGCGKYILIDSTARYNLAGEGCRKGYNGELVRIDSLSQQNYIQNWLNTLRRCFSKHIVLIMGILSIFYIVLYAYCFYEFSELLHHCVCACLCVRPCVVVSCVVLSDTGTVCDHPMTFFSMVIAPESYLLGWSKV